MYVAVLTAGCEMPPQPDPMLDYMCFYPYFPRHKYASVDFFHVA